MRRMIEAMSVMMLDGVAMVITRARDANMAVHTSPDSRGSNSGKIKVGMNWINSKSIFLSINANK